MIATAPIEASSTLLAQIANPAVRALALAAAAGLALLAFRVKATSVRLFTWTSVLYAALAMPLLGWLLPPMGIPAPAFVQSVLGQDTPVAEHLEASPRITHVPAAHAAPSKRHESAPIASIPAATDSTEVASSAASSFLSTLSWTTVALALYLVVASLLLARICVGLVLGHRLIRTSRPVDDLHVHLPGSAVVIAESDLISVPVTLGALRSTILLPTGWRDWPASKLDAVLAHELSHVVRRDPLTQRLALMHRAIFWFSPLAWWLDRCLADLAEQASDEAALSSGADRRHYARILLDFFEALHAAPGRVWWQGVSMAQAGQAEKRLERILSSKGTVAMHFKKSVVIAVVALAVPLVYLAASAHPQHIPLPPDQTFTQDQTPSPAQKPSAATPVPPAAADDTIVGPAPNSLTPPPTAAAPSGGVIGGVIAATPYPPAPAAGAAPRAYAADARARAVVYAKMASHYQHYSYGVGRSYAYYRHDDDDQRFVIVSGKSDSMTMSGSTEDAHHAQKLKKTIPGDFIWFERDEKSYIIRDQATVDRARKFWAEQEELGKKQEELGKQQEALGKQQEELGARMEKVQVQVPDLTAELDKLKAELKALNANGGATMDKIGDIQSEIGDLQSKLGDLQSHAGDQQSKLGDEMGKLGEAQGKLGEEQGKLGERQGELAERATKQMKELLDEALTKGIAQPEP